MSYQIRASDKNQNQIVTELRKCGAFVLDTHVLGNGAPDIFVFYNNVWTPIEIKNGRGKLTPDEREWWDAAGLEPQIATDFESAARWVGLEVGLPFSEIGS
jgi:hypothetical protein